MNSKELIKTSLVQYEFNKRFRLYKKFVEHTGLLYITEDDFPANFSEIGDYNKLILLSVDGGETIVKKHEFPRLHGKKTIMAFIKGEPPGDFFGATYILRKNQQESRIKTIEITIRANNKNFANNVIRELYDQEIQWK